MTSLFSQKDALEVELNDLKNTMRNISPELDMHKAMKIRAEELRIKIQEIQKQL
jgi:hypothetical protein